MKAGKILEEEIKIYLKSAEEHLKAARVLFKKNLYRDSISRSYYALYDAACALLLTKGLTPKTHSGAIRLFALYFVKTKIVPIKYSELFTTIFEGREEADYTRRIKFTEERASETLRGATDFVKMAEKLIPKLLLKTKK